MIWLRSKYNRWFLVLYTLLLYMPEPFFIDAPGIVGLLASLVFNFLFCGFCSYVICSIGELFHKGGKQVFALYNGVMLSTVLLYSISQLTLLTMFGMSWNILTFQALACTNQGETGEFIKAYIMSWRFLSILMATAFLPLVLFLLRKVGNRKTYLSFLKIPFVLFLLGMATELRCFTTDLNYNNDIADKLIRRSSIWNTYQGFLQLKVMGKELDYCRQIQENVTVEECKFTTPNIILIIGESYNKHHSSLYGYGLDTNPLLSKRDSLIVFEDVISSINGTVVSFNDFMTLHCVGDSLPWYRTPMFPAIFKKAGYNVIFYSNQFVCPKNMDVTDANLGYLCNPAIAKYMFHAQNSEKFQYDMQLVDHYKLHRGEIEKENRNLIMFHLMGQHIAPEMRYPEEFAYFKASDIERADLTEEQKQQVANYDNATRYNDRVADEIIRMYEDKDALIMYFADHGDEVNDFRPKVGRSADFAEVGALVFHNQLDIPFLVYPTATFRDEHQELYQEMLDAINKPFMIDALPHLLLHLAGIKTAWYKPELDLFSTSYDMERKRVMEFYGLDYDKFTKRHANEES